MGDHVTVDPSDLHTMARITLDGASQLSDGYRQFLRSSLPAPGAFGSSAAGRELEAASTTVARAAVLTLGAVSGVLHQDVTGLHRTAKGYAAAEHHSAGLITRARHLISDLL